MHLVCLPHTRVTREFATCAYTQKAFRFSKMMAARGFEVVLYAPEGSDDTHCEVVETLSEMERVAIFGADDANRLPAWPTDAEFALSNDRALRAIKDRWQDGDVVLLSSGYSMRELAAELPFCVEPFVGYEGIVTPYCAFESNAWRHFLYGKRGINDGRWFDTVIPNYFDVEDFPVTAEGGEGDYLLFIGRLIERKGPHIALEIAKAADMRLLIAGPGALDSGDGFVQCPWGRLEGDLEYVGPVGIEGRCELMSGARATLVPTTYIEPFGGVAVESMLCGTPAITSPWGAFSETVEDGLTGYRFATLGEAEQAVYSAESISRERVRSRAVERFSLEAVGREFEDWLCRLDSLWRDGWYTRAAAAEVG